MILIEVKIKEKYHMVEAVKNGNNNTVTAENTNDAATTGHGLNASEFKIYDRQLRLWGFEA